MTYKKMKSKGTPAELEARRRRAAKLLARGKGTNEVARLVAFMLGLRWGSTNGGTVFLRSAASNGGPNLPSLSRIKMRTRWPVSRAAL